MRTGPGGERRSDSRPARFRRRPASPGRRSPCGCHRRGCRPPASGDSLSATFLGLGILTTVTLIPVLHDAHVGLDVLVVAVAGVVAGHAIGSRLFARLTIDRFELLLIAIIFVAGATSLALGVDSI